MDWTSVLLYVLGLVVFTFMMVFPDKRDWLHLEDKLKNDRAEKKTDKKNDNERDNNEEKKG